MKYLFFVFGSILLWALCTSVSIAQDKEAVSSAHDTMIVLDASGSMWGQIEGEAKISIAKNVVGDMLTEWDDNIGLGLIAYGHRRKGDCSDIETLVSVADGTAANVSTKVKTLNPKGKTPITASLRKAADALKYKENGATVILVSDGLETCNADPCALAKELEASGVDFTAHIIGFGLKEEEFKSLQCIATETGGNYFTANTADELTGALKETVETAKKTGARGLKAFAAACEDCAPYKDVTFHWSVYGLDEQDNKTGKAIDSGVTQGHLMNIKPGRYYLEGRLDFNSNISGGKIIEVKDEGLTTEVLVIPAGVVNISAISNEGGAAVKSNINYGFYGPQDEKGKRVRYAISTSSSDTLWLPEGDIFVSASHGKAKASQDITIKAGKDTSLILDMKVGYLNVSARLSEDSEVLKGSKIWVNTAGTGTSSSNSVDYITHHKVARFILSEGDYVVTSNPGDAVGRIDATVTAGEINNVTITIDGGSVKLLAGYEEGQPINGIDWVILDTQGKKVAASSRFQSSRPTFILNSGKYTARVEKKYETVASIDFEITAGVKEDIFIVIPKSKE